MTIKTCIGKSGELLRIKIANEQKLNAISVKMWNELALVFHQARSEHFLKCILIEGEGTRSFSSGADIAEFFKVRDTRDNVAYYHENVVGRALDEILNTNVPVIAKIRGACIGGGLEIASCCDLRLADNTARFGAPVAQLGFPLAFGETQILFNLVGSVVVSELLLEGRIYSAEEALRRGLVTRVVDAPHLDQEIEETVERITKSTLGALRDTKTQIRRLIRDRSPVSDRERNEMYAFAESSDYLQRISSFINRNKS